MQVLTILKGHRVGVALIVRLSARVCNVGAEDVSKAGKVAVGNAPTRAAQLVEECATSCLVLIHEAEAAVEAWDEESRLPNGIQT